MSIRTALSPAEEKKFKQWFAEWVEAGIADKDPDESYIKYDYRGAFKDGVSPEIDKGDGLLHWPSEYKDDDHPNRYVSDDRAGGGMQDTKYGKPVSRNRQPEILRQRLRNRVNE